MPSFVADVIKSVTITPQAQVKSWRIAFVFYLLVLGAFAYIMLELVYFHRYAEYSPANSFVNIWHVSGRNRTQHFQHVDATTGALIPGGGKANNEYSYCRNTTFNWELEPRHMKLVGPFRMENLACRWFHDAEAIVSGDNYFGIATNINYVDPITGQHEFILPTQQESVVLKMQHAVTLPDGTEYPNPECQVFDHTGNVAYTISRFDHVSWTMADVMRLVGKKLDDIAPQSADVNGTWPAIRYRNSGMMIRTQIKYFNTVTGVAGMRIGCHITLKLSATSWGNLGSVLGASGASLDRYGIRVVFVPTGELGTISPYRIVLHFISGFVLLTIVRLIVMTVVKGVQACPKSSRFHKDFIVQHEFEIRPPSGVSTAVAAKMMGMEELDGHDAMPLPPATGIATKTPKKKSDMVLESASDQETM